MSASIFTVIPSTDWVASNELAFAVRDAFPVSRGHTLVIPKRCFPTWFEASTEERLALFALVDEVKAELDATLHPDGYNIGINAGEAAGQTVMHLHVHVIPRFTGDVEDPRGGIRHLMPGKGNYLATAPAPLVTGEERDPLLLHIRPLWAKATEVAILAAFVQESGLRVLHDDIQAALERRARIRLITGDYLDITQASALEMLLDWSSLFPAGFEARVVETENLPTAGRSFHPKSWRFEGPGFGTGFVGSSNLSHSALRTGVEWNLRVERSQEPVAWRQLCDGFESWWARARPLDQEWVGAYAKRARAAGQPLPKGEVEPEALGRAPEPHKLQLAALDALANTRASGRTRACVVLATGLGKTLLAAMDVSAWADANGRMPRTLFIAHREELLEQAAATFRRVLRERWPGLRLGFCVGEKGSLDGDVVFASVQKLSRPDWLRRLEPSSFDFVIVDETHHAAAPSYRTILDRFETAFVLGLTATPERADGGDVLGLFDEHVAYRADLGVGISEGLLAPFAYVGVKDEIDYANLPWRNHRFDPEALSRAAETEARMETLWRAWGENPGVRTLLFCCTVRHAEFATGWLKARGVRVECVHAGPGSFDREDGLQQLRAGRLEALCVVDLFNEGIDLPELDRVIMLRPTESPVIFLQQLGRGLRKHATKEALRVIDFVGNHRIFLERVRTLLAFADAPGGLHRFLDGEPPALPPGCSVELELEAKALLEQMLPRGASEMERVFRELHASRGVRPTAGELFRMGHLISSLRERYGGWFHFVKAMGALSETEALALERAAGWLEDLERTPMQKCFKMVTLEVLLETGSLFDGLALPELARKSHAWLARNPELFVDLEGVKQLPDPHNGTSTAFLGYWNDNPIAALIGRDSKKARAWFELRDRKLVSRLPRERGIEDPLIAMTRELVDLRLAKYRRRQRAATGGTTFEAKLTWNKRDPILKLPEGGRPIGDVVARLPDGSNWLFRFAKIACNVATPVGSKRNQLPDLLRSWFGPTAGHPGTAFYVRFVQDEGEWRIEPSTATVLPLRTLARRTITCYPDLRAAAGALHGDAVEGLESFEIELPGIEPRDDLFAVRVAGNSMDGGKSPIRDGDWAVLRWARDRSLSELEGRVALFEVHQEGEGSRYLLKRLVRDGASLLLRSNNPSYEPIRVDGSLVPIALLHASVPPTVNANGYRPPGSRSK